MQRICHSYVFLRHFNYQWFYIVKAGNNRISGSCCVLANPVHTNLTLPSDSYTNLIHSFNKSFILAISKLIYHIRRINKVHSTFFITIDILITSLALKTVDNIVLSHLILKFVSRILNCVDSLKFMNESREYILEVWLPWMLSRKGRGTTEELQVYN